VNGDQPKQTNNNLIQNNVQSKQSVLGRGGTKRGAHREGREALGKPEEGELGEENEVRKRAEHVEHAE
jgi:hypothetical protein